jgi:hypothetical protein
LYRLVKRGYIKLKNSERRPSSQAFTSPRYRISVDRARLCGNDPAYTQVDDTDFVCSVVAGEVRSITITHNRPTGAVTHNIRVDATPTPKNPAHADIYAHPDVATKGVFRKLQERLAQLARWEDWFGPSDED